MLIERADNTISLCEMKFANGEFELTEDEAQNIRRRMDCLSAAVKNRKAIQVALVTPYGLRRNRHADGIQQVVTADRLFMPSAYC